MKRILSLALILFLCSFTACKKSEEASESKKEQVQNGEMRASEAAKKKRGKKAGGPPALVIYQEDKLITTIPADQYPALMTGNVKVDGKDYKAILLSDLLKKYNVTAKTVTLKGPAKASSITWEQMTANPIYVYLFKNRLQIYNDSNGLETVKLPTVLVQITAAEKPAATPPVQAKGSPKNTN